MVVAADTAAVQWADTAAAQWAVAVAFPAAASEVAVDLEAVDIEAEAFVVGAFGEDFGGLAAFAVSGATTLSIIRVSTVTTIRSGGTPAGTSATPATDIRPINTTITADMVPMAPRIRLRRYW